MASDTVWAFLGCDGDLSCFPCRAARGTVQPSRLRRNVNERSADRHPRVRSRHQGTLPAGEPLAGVAGCRGRARPGAGRTRHHPARRRRGDRACRTARTAGSRADRRRLRPHRPHHRAAGVGAVPRGRRAARRLGALGCHDAEHHPDRRPAGAAPGAPHLPPPDRRGADARWPISRNAARTCRWPAARTASTRCRPRSATRSRCGSTSCCAMSSGCARPRRGCSSPCWAAAPAHSPRWASRGRRCRRGSAGSWASAR